mmetsp:Transcript_13435/g.23818  ORF Transcript_13435/g.23818 Transcript_13435/m.23818 type:complete len:226 (-) Transcript_13435:782-1459(-)
MTDVARVASSRRHRIFDQSSSTRVQHPNKGYLGEGCTGSKDGKAHGRSTLQVMRSVASTTGRLTSSYLPRCHLSRFTSLAAPKYSCPLFLTCCQLLVLDGFLFGEVFSHISVALFGVFCLFSMRWSNTFRLRLIITFPPSSRIEVRSSSCPLPCFASAVRPFASHTKTAHARSASFTTSVSSMRCRTTERMAGAPASTAASRTSLLSKQRSANAMQQNLTTSSSP